MIKHTIILLIMLLFLSCANKIEVPKDVYQHVDGTVTHIVRIEITLPESVIKTYQTDCKNECLVQLDETQQCIDSCTSKKESEYINSLLNLIQQFQQTVGPSPGPTNP